MYNVRHTITEQIPKINALCNQENTRLNKSLSAPKFKEQNGMSKNVKQLPLILILFFIKPIVNPSKQKTEDQA